MTTINVKAPKVNREVSFEYDFGSNLKEMIAKFGEDMVYNQALDNMVIACQAVARNKLERGQKFEKTADGGYRVTEKDKKKFLSDAAIVKEMTEEWKPEMRKAADPEKVKAEMVKRLSKLSEEEKAAMIEELKKSIGAAA